LSTAFKVLKQASARLAEATPWNSFSKYTNTTSKISVSSAGARSAAQATGLAEHECSGWREFDECCFLQARYGVPEALIGTIAETDAMIAHAVGNNSQ
jgi:hypothetical protein